MALASAQLSKQVTGDTGAAKLLVFSVREEHQADTIAKGFLQELVICSAQMRLIIFTAKGKGRLEGGCYLPQLDPSTQTINGQFVLPLLLPSYAKFLCKMRRSW